MVWKRYTANPSARNTDDEILTVLSVAFNWTWKESYIQLAKYGIGCKLSMNDKRCWKGFLKYLGYSEHKTTSKYNVTEFADTIAKSNKTYILQIGSNATVIKNKVVYSSYNPSNKLVNAYWRI